jgi:hypothetical protein
MKHRKTERGLKHIAAVGASITEHAPNALVANGELYEMIQYPGFLGRHYRQPKPKKLETKTLEQLEAAFLYAHDLLLAREEKGLEALLAFYSISATDPDRYRKLSLSLARKSVPYFQTMPMAEGLVKPRGRPKTLTPDASTGLAREFQKRLDEGKTQMEAATEISRLSSYANAKPASLRRQLHFLLKSGGVKILRKNRKPVI